MATAIIRKPDAGGVRIDVTFTDRDEAEFIWDHRHLQGNLSKEVRVRSEARGYQFAVHTQPFLYDVAALAAKEYLKLDPLDEPPVSGLHPRVGTLMAGGRS